MGSIIEGTCFTLTYRKKGHIIRQYVFSLSKISFSWSCVDFPHVLLSPCSPLSQLLGKIYSYSHGSQVDKKPKTLSCWRRYDFIFFNSPVNPIAQCSFCLYMSCNFRNLLPDDSREFEEGRECDENMYLLMPSSSVWLVTTHFLPKSIFVTDVHMLSCTLVKYR